MAALPHPEAARRTGRLKLWLVLVICAAPVIASYIVYYGVRPDARSNYGALVEPQRPTPALHLTTPDGRPFDAASLRGKWILLMVAGGDCTGDCPDRLYHLRQVRLTTGKERDRVERVWLIPDAAPLSTMLMREYDGTVMLRADPAELRAWLGGAGGGADGSAGGDDDYARHLYVVDPLGNLMMRFPEHADPNRTKRDLAKLLAASRIG